MYIVSPGANLTCSSFPHFLTLQCFLPRRSGTALKERRPEEHPSFSFHTLVWGLVEFLGIKGAWNNLRPGSGS